jgi:hypothetical protein
MNLKHLSIICLCTVMLIACKNDKNQSSTTPIKDVSELTYIEIYRLLYSNNNGGFDAHGDLYGQEAISFLDTKSIADTCGDELFINNTSDRAIDFAVKASFNLTGNQVNEMVRAYTIKPAEKISIGNSILCYNNKEHMIKKEIISAGFTTK